MRNLVYFLKEAVRGFFQAKLMTSVSILTIGASLLFFGLVALVYLNFQQWLDRASRELRLVAYVDDTVAADAAKLAALVKDVEGRPLVSGVEVVDKEEAWRRFEANYGTAMLSAVERNPFPAALELSLAGPRPAAQEVERLIAALGENPAITGTSYLHDWLQRLQRIRSVFLAAAAITLVVVIIALNFMIANTIKLTIYARRELVTNMRLVGATDFYIEMPFVLEGMLQGLVGGAAAALVLAAARLWVPPSVLHWGPAAGLLILPAGGMLFGLFGSLSAVRKFLT